MNASAFPLKTDPNEGLPPSLVEELKQLETLIGLDPLMKLLDALEKEVAEKPLATRFSRTAPPADIYEHGEVGAAIHLARMEDPTEAGRKKAELTIAIASARSSFMIVHERLRDLLINIRASQTV